MNRFVFALILGVATSATALSQTYYVHSATVEYWGNVGHTWPTVSEDTRTGSPPFLGNGYVWQASAAGSQLNPGGLQSDGYHNKVDAYYSVTSDATYYGSGNLSAAHGVFGVHRNDIIITFTIRCNYAFTPPSPGAGIFEARCQSNADVNPISSPAYNVARAHAYYIPPLSNTVQDWFAEAEKPWGVEGVDLGFVQHKNLTNPASNWTSVGTNLWESTVTVPLVLPMDDPDQDLLTEVGGTSASFGSFATARSHAHAQYQYRLVGIDGVTLQAGY